MKTKSRVGTNVIVALGLLSFGSLAYTQTQSPVSTTNQPKTIQKETPVSTHARGAFEVKMNPQTDEKVGDPTVGRMALDKQYHGDLDATSKGQMLATMTEVQGSAGYVALERVNGTLGDSTTDLVLRSFSFCDINPSPNPQKRVTA